MASEGGRRDGKLILVVDDEPACRIALEDVLRSAGHEVHSAGTREHALALVLRHAYDLVVLDNNLSGVPGSHDGLDVLCAIRGRSRGTRVVIVTAYGSAMLAHAARELGAVSYLEKPVPLAALIETLESQGVRCTAAARG
jgi:DNA-binding NtrC family response regulator